MRGKGICKTLIPFFLTFLALYGRQKSIEGIGLFFTVYAASMLVTRPLLGRLIDPRGFDAGIWPGIVLIPVALLVLSVSNSLIFSLICAVFYEIGIGAVLVGFISAIMGYSGMFAFMAIFPILVGILYYVDSRYKKLNLRDE